MLRAGVTFIALLAFVAAAPAHAQPPVVAVNAGPGHFSPNGDRRDDRVAANVTVSEPATLDVQVMDRKGVPVASLASATAVGVGMTRLTWDGKAATGKRVQDGRYTIHTTATGPALEATATDVNVVVDTHAPRVRWRFSRPLHLTRRMRALPISIVDLSDTSRRVKLLVETEAGAPMRSFLVRSEGREVDVRALRKLEPGLYHVHVEVSDIVGNVGASPDGDVIVDHPVSSRVVARFLGVGRRVALTFDDCQVGSAWNSILTTLQRFHAKATFFCPGAAVLQNTAAALRTVRLGHTIGDHSFNHPVLSTYSFGAARSQFLRDQAIWWRLAKRTPLPYFRPPYGAYDHTTLAAAGSAEFAWTVLWDVDTRDWTRPGSNTIAARVLGEMRSGSIVLMHTLPQTAAALPTILRGLRRRHYQPLPLDQLFLLHGAQPSPGGWAP